VGASWRQFNKKWKQQEKKDNGGVGRGARRSEIQRDADLDGISDDGDGYLEEDDDLRQVTRQHSCREFEDDMPGIAETYEAADIATCEGCNVDDLACDTVQLFVDGEPEPVQVPLCKPCTGSCEFQGELTTDTCTNTVVLREDHAEYCCASCGHSLCAKHTVFVWPKQRMCVTCAGEAVKKLGRGGFLASSLGKARPHLRKDRVQVKAVSS
jgi:hypothetical protein